MRKSSDEATVDCNAHCSLVQESASMLSIGRFRFHS
jgi:hypothetical protein